MKEIILNYDAIMEDENGAFENNFLIIKCYYNLVILYFIIKNKLNPRFFL